MKNSIFFRVQGNLEDGHEIGRIQVNGNVTEAPVFATPHASSVLAALDSNGVTSLERGEMGYQGIILILQGGCRQPENGEKKGHREDIDSGEVVMLPGAKVVARSAPLFHGSGKREAEAFLSQYTKELKD
jgi:hypothetical protein